MLLQEKHTGTRIVTHSSPHLNSTTGGNTHNALLDAFVLNWLRIGGSDPLLSSSEPGYFKISLGGKTKGEMKGEEAQTHTQTGRPLIF